MCKFRDANGPVGTHVVSLSGLPPLKQHQQPVSEILLIKIGPQRRPVPANHDLVTPQRIPNEVPDCEMHVKWQIRADKGEATGNDRAQAMFLAI
ncbi:hypothetical protein GALL_322630 [mine drainage metagenome]|uniref:Uncharacterized protein n=1 Tax=mine drainage metagenome TaxID=410659 RepID=A0A1J5R867_9ZZZZ